MPLNITDLSAAIAALVSAGYEVMFTESAHGAGQVDAYLMLNSATTVGTGPAPAAALAAVWPEDVEVPGPACACGHGYRDHAIRLADRSRSSCTTGCGCRVYAPAGPETAPAPAAGAPSRTPLIVAMDKGDRGMLLGYLAGAAPEAFARALAAMPEIEARAQQSGGAR